MDAGCEEPQDLGVHRFDDPDALPALLAEYGRLAARLPAADPGQAALLRERLRALDEAIDRLVEELGTTKI